MTTKKDPEPQSQPRDPAGDDPRNKRPQKAPDPDRGDQPVAEPLDRTREGVGDWSTPPPGYKAPIDRGPAARSARVTSGEGPVPRVVDQNDRAPGLTEEEEKAKKPKLRRYKVRADIAGDVQPTWYILAESEDQAVEHYMAETGLQKKLDRARKVVPQTVAPEMVVTELPD